MSDRSRRHRIPVPIRTPQQPSPSPRRRTSFANRRSSKASRPFRILRRSKSDPNLLTSVVAADGDVHRNLEAADGVLYRPRTCTDIFSSSESLPPFSPQKIEVRLFSPSSSIRLTDFSFVFVFNWTESLIKELQLFGWNCSF